MLSRNHSLVLFIDRFGFAIYQDSLVNIPKFSFTPDLVSNLDVINKEQFLKLIGTFIEVNKMPPSVFTVILSDNIIYIKDLPNLAPKTALPPGVKNESVDQKYHEKDVQDFLEDIPFEEVMAKVLKMINGNRVVATNKDLIMSIVEAFRTKGFVIEGVVPAFIYAQRANFATGLNAENAKAVIEDAENLKENNLLNDQEKIVLVNTFDTELKTQANEEKKPQNLRQYILIGVFATLLMILVVVYFNMGASQVPLTKKTPVGISVQVTPTAIPTLVPQINLINSDFYKNLKIKVTYTTEVAEKVNAVRVNLASMGVENFEPQSSEFSLPEKSSVIFSADTPQERRTEIIREIKKTIPEFTILEDQMLKSTINIVIGKS